MSADNWRECPRRLAMETARRMAAIAAADAAYGKVPAPEYRKLQEAANKPWEAGRDTLREDYELRIRVDGVFEVDYSAGCETCGLTYRFQRKEQVPL